MHYMNGPRLSRRFCWLTAGALLCVACSGVTQACTDIGCESGVKVHLSAMPTSPFRVELRTLTGQGVAYVYDCADASKCSQDIFFPGLITDHLIVTVHVGTAARDTDIPQMTYVSHRPNGPNCPPDCRIATVTADVPA